MVELGYVPLLIWCAPSLPRTGGSTRSRLLADFSAEGVVPFATTHQVQCEGAHQCEHGFLRHPPSLPSQDGEDTSAPFAFSMVSRMAS
jgi:hypothetical protein